MRNILLALAGVFLLTGCFSREMTEAEKVAETNLATAVDKERDTAGNARAAAMQRDLAKEKAIAQAAANLAPVADAIESKGEPGIANVTRDQKRNIDSVLDLPAMLYPSPTVTLAGLLKDAEAERSKAQHKANELQMQLGQASAQAAKAEQDRLAAEAKAEAARELAAEEKKRADAEASKAWWLQAGGVALGVITAAAGLAARLGLPGGTLVNGLIGVVSPMLTREKKVADATVAAADVGRSALSMLDIVLQNDPELCGKIAGKVSQLTGGRADGVEGLFKLAAKSYTLDQSAGQADAIDKKLNVVRDSVIPTEAGIPVVLKSLLKMA